MDYKVVDVFTSEVFKGNPVAVVLNGSNLDTPTMQSIARWTNLSETTFVVPTTNDEADYHLRIFTPSSELPFAGHPSLGTAHALLESGLVERKPHLIQQCKRGNIQINVYDDELEFGLDNMTSEDISLSDVKQSLTGLKVIGQPQVVYCGPAWVVVEIDSNESELISYSPDLSAIKAFSKAHNVAGICVFASHSSGPDNNIELRTFAPVDQIDEDPVCGSGNAAVAFYRNLGRPYISYQGSALFRNGKIQLSYREGKVWVKGSCVTGIEGNLRDLKM